jgi:hypothetical protein
MRPGACRAYTLLRLLSSMKHEATRSITSPVPSVTTARRSPCARWITSRSIRRSTCASMWRVLSPRLPSQPRTSRAMNAGPLPGRICSGCHGRVEIGKADICRRRSDRTLLCQLQDLASQVARLRLLLRRRVSPRSAGPRVCWRTWLRVRQPRSHQDIQNRFRPSRAMTSR